MVAFVAKPFEGVGSVRAFAFVDANVLWERLKGGSFRSELLGDSRVLGEHESCLSFGCEGHNYSIMAFM